MPYLRVLRLTTSKMVQADQNQCFSITVLGTDNEPRDRPGYSVACRALLSKVSDAEKAKERRMKGRNHRGEAPVNPTDGSNPHNHGQHSASGSPVDETVPPPIIYQQEIPSSAPHSAQIGSTLSAPSGTIPSFPIGIDTHSKAPPNLGDQFEDPADTEVCRKHTEPGLDTLLGAGGSGVGLQPTPSPTRLANHLLPGSTAPLGSPHSLLSPIPPFISPEPPSPIALDMESYTFKGDAMDVTTAMQRSSSATPTPALEFEGPAQSSHLRSPQSTMALHHPCAEQNPTPEVETSNKTALNPSPNSSRRTPPVLGSSQSDMLPVSRQTDVQSSHHRGKADERDRPDLETHNTEGLGVNRLRNHVEQSDGASADSPIRHLDPKTWSRLLREKAKQKSGSSKLLTSKTSRARALPPRAANAGSEVTQIDTGHIRPNQSEASLFPDSPLTGVSKRHSEPFQVTPGTVYFGEVVEAIDHIVDGDSRDNLPEDEWAEVLKKPGPSKCSTGAAGLDQRTQDPKGPHLEKSRFDGLVHSSAAQAYKIQRQKAAQKRSNTDLGDVCFGSSGFIDWKSNDRVPSGDDNSAYQVSQDPEHSPNPLSPMQSESTGQSSLPQNTPFIPLQKQPGEDNLDPWSNVVSPRMPHMGSLNLDLCQDAAGSSSRPAPPAVAHSIPEAVPEVNADAEGQFTAVSDDESGLTDLVPTIEQRAVISSQRASRAIRRDPPKGQQLLHVEVPRLSASQKARYKRHLDQQPGQVSQSAIRSGYLINSNDRRDELSEAVKKSLIIIRHAGKMGRQIITAELQVHLRRMGVTMTLTRTTTSKALQAKGLPTTSLGEPRREK